MTIDLDLADLEEKTPPVPELRPGAGFYLDVVATGWKFDPTKLPPLGATVRYRALAAVARRVGKVWVAYDGWGKGRKTSGFPPLAYVPEDADPISFAENPAVYLPPRDPRTNKEIVVWPVERAGVAVGLVRKAIGESASPSGGRGGLFGDDFEPGWFAAETVVPLLVVKHHLTSLDEFSLVPIWALADG